MCKYTNYKCTKCGGETFVDCTYYVPEECEEAKASGKRCEPPKDKSEWVLVYIDPINCTVCTNAGSSSEDEVVEEGGENGDETSEEDDESE